MEKDMPELRQNVATREWVIISTERAKRPEDFKNKKVKKDVPSHIDSCPFCTGNETLTPPELFRIPDNAPSWSVRVTPNKFAALTDVGNKDVWKLNGIMSKANGVGHHDVIIDSPRHNGYIPTLTSTDMNNLFSAYVRRFKEVSQDPRTEHVIIFKNHGKNAGTSLEHPHTQIVALPVVPSHVRQRIEEAMQYYDSHGQCVFCTIRDEELKLSDRVIHDSEHFTALVPYAAYSPFNIWVIPKRHAASFGDISQNEISDLAKIMKIIISKLHFGLDDPDYNYIIRTVPVGGCNSKYFHWYIDIVPRLTKMAGFELGTGMFINVSLPEENAAFLRSVKIPD